MARVLGKNELGYVRGIGAAFSSPNAFRIGGTTTNDTGPIVPITSDQKIAGFSIDAHRRYRKGWEKNRGTPDIVSGSVRTCARLSRVEDIPN